ncbi:hypothetical protein KFK09_028640 [Dendrobium nobile]|uniref:Reverse transcriptase domain-containing protein n=1 Tax=Dendrobium nobile TaxID=94219 RepID=A0A8T3A3M3_DENNO|nr:hypothetical protein KFK09_028640 [Dendrobium nobile]
MDAFSYLFDNMEEGSSFQLVYINGFKISHLLYMDDVLVFGKATQSNYQVSNDILLSFATSSDLKVNPDKNYIIMQANSPYSKEICDTLHIQNLYMTFTYLGIPISIKICLISQFSPLLDIITN